MEGIVRFAIGLLRPLVQDQPPHPIEIADGQGETLFRSDG